VVRRLLPIVLLVAFVATACGGSGETGAPTRVTVGASGPLAKGLLTQTQLRQVPGLSSAKVTTLEETAIFEDPDPRGPCGGKVPAVSLKDAVGVAISAQTIRGGAELIARLPSGVAQAYLDARMANTTLGCPEYQTVTHQGATQRVQLVRIVRLHREFQQALAVVTALKVGDSVRAATQIEVRYNDIISRVVIFTNVPMANVAVRGIASLMGSGLLVFDSK
jgi:hypothetical protein